MSLMRTDNSIIVEELKLLNKNVERQLEKDQRYNEWCYSNMRLTLLERVFFSVYSRYNEKSNTKLFRIYLRALMRRNPNMVEQSKKMIDDGSYADYIKER